MRFEAAEFNLDLLRERAEANFITVTELADTIVREDGLPFSAAHAIVAEAVARATNGEGVVTHDILQSAAEGITGRQLSLSAEDVGLALSAANFVAIRNVYGGPAREETSQALAEQRESAVEASSWRGKRPGAPGPVSRATR